MSTLYIVMAHLSKLRNEINMGIKLNCGFYLDLISSYTGTHLLFQDLIQDTPLHLFIMFPSVYDSFLVSSCFPWTWQFWRVLVKYFAEFPPLGVSLGFPHYYMGLWIFVKSTVEVMCPSHHSSWLSVSARSFPYKIITFSSPYPVYYKSITNFSPYSWRGESYISIFEIELQNCHLFCKIAIKFAKLQNKDV